MFLKPKAILKSLYFELTVVIGSRLFEFNGTPMIINNPKIDKAYEQFCDVLEEELNSGSIVKLADDLKASEIK